MTCYLHSLAESTFSSWEEGLQGQGNSKQIALVVQTPFSLLVFRGLFYRPGLPCVYSRGQEIMTPAVMHPLACYFLLQVTEGMP